MRDRGIRRLRSGEAGTTLLELMFVSALMVTLTAVALPTFMVAVHQARAAGAAHYLAGRLRQARMEAVKRSAFVALRFQPTPSGYRYTVYVDRNGNGVRTADIRLGIDTPLGASEALGEVFPGVIFGLRDGVPYVDGASSAGGADPVRVGASNILSFSPLGSATPGTLYVLGRGAQQYAVRVLGVNGRTRTLRFDYGGGTWVAQ